ncbi:MAG: SsrA-binding protein SmpB [bacterium]
MAKGGGQRDIARNRKAYFNFHILEKYEAGIALLGAEVKSVRGGGISLKEGFAVMKEGELWLVGVQISPYKNAAGHAAPDPLRSRKLLLHRRELDKIAGKVQAKGLTIVPLRVYINNNRVKVEVGLARGKKKYDKKQDIIEKDLKREVDRAVKAHS